MLPPMELSRRLRRDEARPCPRRQCAFKAAGRLDGPRYPARRSSRPGQDPAALGPQVRGWASRLGKASLFSVGAAELVQCWDVGE
jgi:hypothetical protein